MFRKLDLFPWSGERKKATTFFGPFERTNLNQQTSCFLHFNRNTSSFRIVVFPSYLDFLTMDKVEKLCDSHVIFKCIFTWPKRLDILSWLLLKQVYSALISEHTTHKLLWTWKSCLTSSYRWLWLLCRFQGISCLISIFVKPTGTSGSLVNDLSSVADYILKQKGFVNYLETTSW
jgi:hypothetical protein